MGCICYENPKMGIYFISDPDGYWIEILPKKVKSRAEHPLIKLLKLHGLTSVGSANFRALKRQPYITKSVI